MSGPTTPASACPEVAPNTPTATAIASSKSFDATVNDSAAVCAYGKPINLPATNPATHITAKYTSSGTAMRTTSTGWEVISSPWIANRRTIVKRSP